MEVCATTSTFGLAVIARTACTAETRSGTLANAARNSLRTLDASLAADRPRALIQMATGSGKTYTAITTLYRMLKHAKARRVLFLVDLAVAHARGVEHRQALQAGTQGIGLGSPGSECLGLVEGEHGT
jgi:Type III restriction enzyme, res subunit